MNVLTFPGEINLQELDDEYKTDLGRRGRFYR